MNIADIISQELLLSGAGLPLLVSLPLDVYSLFTGQNSMMFLLFREGPVQGSVIQLTLWFLIFSLVILVLLYLSLMMRLLRDYYVSGRQPVILLNTVYVFLTLLAAASVLGVNAGGSLFAVRWGSTGVTLLFAASCIIGIRYPNLMQLIIRELQQKADQKDILRDIDMDSLKVNLHRLLKEETVYSSDRVTLQDVAENLSITPHQLSCLINRDYKTNFNAFVNRYRIEAAREMLLDDPKRSVLSIAYEVGFNSKSAFYEAFSRITGMTPGEFRGRSSR